MPLTPRRCRADLALSWQRHALARQCGEVRYVVDIYWTGVNVLYIEMEMLLFDLSFVSAGSSEKARGSGRLIFHGTKKSVGRSGTLASLVAMLSLAGCWPV